MRPDDKWLEEHAERLRDAAGAAPLLELGCGGGRDTAQLIAMGHRVVAADLRHEAVASCALDVPAALPLQLNLSAPLPFAAGAFPAVLASLCLHYFAWEVTVGIVGEIRRCLRDGGLLLVRLNSTEDIHHGAGSGEPLEVNFFRVGGRTKRFFDRTAVHCLFHDWRIAAVAHKTILRYEKPKAVWEAILYADP
jgi:SAM-dependent methyltransferase